MFLRRGKIVERSEIAALAGLGVFLARIKTVFAGSQLADHDLSFPLDRNGLRRLPFLL
jgi:hypothetical protein